MRYVVIHDPLIENFPFRIVDLEEMTVLDGANNLGSAQKMADRLNEKTSE